ncbi:MAG: beta-ketoacyl reductase, partial [Gammaproteobacteria bacterium]
MTRNVVAAGIESAAPPGLAHTSVWGMGKVIALEHPELWGGMIDLAPRPTDEEAAELLAELDGEGFEDHILLRAGRRYVGRVEPVAEPAAVPAPLRAEGSYLITGGLGVLGLHVARWMVGQGARSLVLVGRREPSLAARDAVEALRRAGARVTVAGADVASAVELEGVLAAIEASMPPLRGIVHAAGVAGDQPLAGLDADALHAVLCPKIRGAWLLHRLTSHLDLDLFVCFSSIAAVWGSKGQAHYAAANYFLDALADYRRQRGLPAISIGWGPWDGGGMATAEARSRLARVGVRALDPEDALAAMQRSLASPHPRIVIADVDWARFREVYEAARVRPLLEALWPETAPVDAPPAIRSVPLASECAHLPAAERRDWLVAHVQREVASVLGLSDEERPDPTKGFFRLGMDSLMAVELKNRLAAGFRVPLSATVVFDYPNIAELSAYLAESMLGWERPAAVGGEDAEPEREA